MNSETFIKIGLLMAISILFLSVPILSNTQITDSFTKTLVKISKEKVKEGVISWVKTQDPTAGIIARDLITQMIDSKDDDEIVKSSIKVVTTILFLDQISRSIVIIP